MTWRPLAARAAYALRAFAPGSFPDDMTGACQTASVLLALVFEHFGRVALLHTGTAFGRVHAWNVVGREHVDLTATQFGVDTWVHVADRESYSGWGRPMTTHEAGKFLRGRWGDSQAWHPCSPRQRYRVLVPALSMAAGITEREATRRVRAFVGPPAGGGW